MNLEKPTLIVASYALREESTIQELIEYLGSVYVMWKQRSLVIVKTRIDPYKAIDVLRESINPDHTSILKVIPVDDVTPPYVHLVAKRVEEIAEEKIDADETFRITLQGRLYRLTESGTLERLRTIESIRIIAENIDRKVDLEHPDKIVYIRTIKIRGEDYASITVCPPSYILSTRSAKYG